MSAVETLRKHASEVREVAGIEVTLTEEGDRIYIVLSKIHIPGSVFRLRESDILVHADRLYPLSAMDMFWAEVDLVRSDGSIPAGAEQVEQYLGRQWRRFSWHRNGIWNPAGNPLLDHHAFVESRFTREVQQ